MANWKLIVTNEDNEQLVGISDDARIFLGRVEATTDAQQAEAMRTLAEYMPRSNQEEPKNE